MSENRRIDVRRAARGFTQRQAHDALRRAGAQFAATRTPPWEPATMRLEGVPRTACPHCRGRGRVAHHARTAVTCPYCLGGRTVTLEDARVYGTPPAGEPQRPEKKEL